MIKDFKENGQLSLTLSKEKRLQHVYFPIGSTDFQGLSLFFRDLWSLSRRVIREKEIEVYFKVN